MPGVASITPSEILSRFNTLGTNALKAPSAPPSVVSNLQHAASNAAQSVSHLAAAGTAAAESVGVSAGSDGLLEKFKNKYLTPRNIAIVLLVVGGVIGLVYMYFEFKKRQKAKQEAQMKAADEQARQLIEEANQRMKEKQQELQEQEKEKQEQEKKKQEKEKQEQEKKKQEKQQEKKETVQTAAAPATPERDPDFTLLSELSDIV